MVVSIDGECYYHEFYDPFNQIECKFDPSCTGSFRLISKSESIFMTRNQSNYQKKI